MPQPNDSRADTLAHIHLVRDRIEEFVAALLARGRIHDASKFDPAEKPLLDEVLPLLGDIPYGTPEFRALEDRARPALEHHYRRNPHHPEHHRDGIAGMDLVDLVEMICDWMAAAARGPQDGVNLAYNVKQFGIEPQLAAILANTLARWPGRTS
jgi:hypothetical protein